MSLSHRSPGVPEGRCLYCSFQCNPEGHTSHGGPPPVFWPPSHVTKAVRGFSARLRPPFPAPKYPFWQVPGRLLVPGFVPPCHTSPPLRVALKATVPSILRRHRVLIAALLAPGWGPLREAISRSSVRKTKGRCCCSVPGRKKLTFGPLGTSSPTCASTLTAGKTSQSERSRASSPSAKNYSSSAV